MADGTVCNVDDTPVFIDNTSETSEITCKCCDKLKLELQETLLELRLAQKSLSCYKEK
jgi:hypothetical protein